MDIDSVQLAQGSPSLAGPSRSRPTRAHSSAKKPYTRSSVQAQRADSINASSGATHGESGGPSGPPAVAPMASSQSTSSRLFSTLTRAISRPLSWLSPPTSVSSKLRDPKLPSSSSASASSSSLLAMTGAHCTDSFATPEPKLRESFGRSGAMLEDVEFRESSLGPVMRSIRPRAPIAQPISAGTSSRPLDVTSQSTPQATNRRTLYIPPSPSATDCSVRSPSPTRSTAASAAIRSYGSHSRFSLGPVGRAGSLAPSDSASVAGSTSATRNQQKKVANFTYGFGSERRIGGLTADCLPSRSPLARPNNYSALARPSSFSSHSHLPSPSPFTAANATSARADSLLRRSGSASQSELGLHTSFPHSPARVAGYPARSRQFGSLTPSASVIGLPSKQRNWSSINLALPSRSRLSDGDELLRDFAASTRRIGTPSLLGTGAKSLGATPIGKRDATDALGLANLDLDDRVSEFGSSLVQGSARKKQMMWDPEHGFISLEELQARQPPKPAPRNEAERILNVLEGMRTPLRDARKAVARACDNVPTRLTQTISVPLPTPLGNQGAAAVGPYSKRRAGRAVINRFQQGDVEEEGMRAKLKRTQRNQSERSPGLRGQDVEEHVDKEETIPEPEFESEKHRKLSPPRRVTRGMTRAKARAGAISPPKSSRKAQTKRSPAKKAGSASASAPTPTRRSTRRRAAIHEDNDQGMASVRDLEPTADVPKSPQKPARAALEDGPEFKAVEAQPPASAAISNPFARKPRFQVIAENSQQPRQMSSLRQGREKTSRSHGKSGKISAWDSDEDEDGRDKEMDSVDMNSLAKIKLPENMFPSGFKFSASPASTPAARDDKALANQNPSTFKASPSSMTAKLEPTPAGKETSSLLGRLGSYSPLSSGNSEARKSAPPAPSSLFAAPPTKSEKKSAPPIDFEKKSGKVPNFFRETGHKAASSAASASDSIKPTFSFGKREGEAIEAISSAMSTRSTTSKPANTPLGTSASDSGASGFSSNNLIDVAPKSTGELTFGKFGEPFKSASGPTVDSETSESGFAFGKSATSTAKSGFPFPKAGETISEAKLTGGVPDFFGVKTAAEGNTSQPSPTSSPTFSGFGLGAAKPETSKPALTFAAQAQPSDSKPDGMTGSAAPASPPFTFGAPSTTSSEKNSGAGAFGTFKGFAATPASVAGTSDSGKRRSNDGGEEEPSAKDNPSASEAPTTTSVRNALGAGSTLTGGFSFGTKLAPTPSSDAPAFPSSLAPSSSTFSFGKPAGTNATPMSTPTFSFDTTSAPSTSTLVAGGFSFKPASTLQSSREAKTAPAPVGFLFGDSRAPSASSSPSPSLWPPASAAPSGHDASNTGMVVQESSVPSHFSFGASKADTTSSSTPPPPPPVFAFGAQPNASISASASTPASAQHQSFAFGSTPISTAPSNPFDAQAAAATATGGFPTGFGVFAPSALTSAPAFAFGQPRSTGGLGTDVSTPTKSSPSINFHFSAGAGGGSASLNTTPSSTAGGAFQFGASTAPLNGGGGGGFTFGAQGVPTSGSSNAPFQFVSGAPPQGGSTSSLAPFTFGGGSTGAPSPHGAFGSATPPPGAGNVLFNIGSGGNDSGGASGPPAGRTVRRLPNRSRRA